MTTKVTEFEYSLSDLKLTGFGNHSFTSETSITLPSLQSAPADRSNTNNTDNAWGINHRQVPLALQQSFDNHGLVFATRPQLNLSDANIRGVRKFSRLLTDNDKSIQRLVRCLLDPRLQYNIGQDSEGNMGGDSYLTQKAIHCPLVDFRQAFIPFFTNNVVAMNGFPDLRAPTYSAKEGPYKEAYGFVDGPTDDYSEYDTTMTLRNIQGDPISALAYFWIHYQSKVHEGIDMRAYGDFIVNREIDYNTRFYRFVLDPSKRFIQRMCMTGAAFPYALNMGAFYDFDSTKPYNEASQSIQIPFKCFGAVYEDDLIIRSFNDVVAYFHPEMGPGNNIINKPNERVMIKVPVEHLSVFNHRGYPWINPNTYEIEWYVSREYYDSKMASYRQFGSRLIGGLGIQI
jgi:hypothetical protein